MEKQINIPKLRFSEFAGEWKEKKLGEIAELTSSKRVYLSDYVNEGIPFYRGKEISELKQGIQPKDILYISEKAYNDFKKGFGVPTTNDLLITAVGTLGNVLKIRNDEPFYFKDGNLIWLRKISEDSDFLETLLHVKYKDIEKSAIGSSQKALTMVELRKLAFLLPPFPEQTKIADFLTAVDDKLTQLKKKKSLLEQYKKGVMQKLFSQELRFKDENGEDFTEWEEKNIKDILTIGSGKDYKHLNSGSIPVFGTGGLMTFVDSWLYEGETVCIGRKGTIDKPMFYSGKIWTVDTLFYTHSFTMSIPKFIYYVFQCINWKEYNEASGVPSLSKSTIEKIAIPIPTVPEQTKIANYLSVIDDKIKHCDMQIEKMGTWKKGLLQKMFV